MRYLVETEFFVTLKVWRVDMHDKANVALWEETLMMDQESGPFEIRQQAEAEELILQKEYKSNIFTKIQIKIEEREILRAPEYSQYYKSIVNQYP